MNAFTGSILTMELMSTNPANQYFQIVIVSVGLLTLIATVWWQIDTASEEENSETVTISPFDTIDLSGALHVLVLCGHETTLKLRGSRKALSWLRVRQYGQTLKIGNRFFLKAWGHHKSLFITITTPTLRHLEISGANVVQVNGFTDLTSLDMNITGASNVSFEGSIGFLSTEITGASRLTLQGTGQHLNAEITGASSLHALHYATEIAGLELAGACSARVKVSKQLTAELAGASRVQYQGEPMMHVKSAGASSVSRV